MTQDKLSSDNKVRHLRHGVGDVVLDKGATVVVRFEGAIEEVSRQELEIIENIWARLDAGHWDTPLSVINRIQAAAIFSANSAWGVFSRSRIELLPHQLWVCKKITEKSPSRWLIADDVGLGKTIEAGMALLSYISRSAAKRILIICPASLKEQWHSRLYSMFGINFTIYSPEADLQNGAFWEGTQIVASLQTLRVDRKDRHARLLEAEAWDIVMVDEAHHLNAEEGGRYTLGYKLVAKLVEEERVKTMLFFTGTPHRGKDYGFLSLLKLLRPDLFNPQLGLDAHLKYLPDVMIRNNKVNVTNLNGDRLFKPHTVETATFSYSSAEKEFYQKLTEFISTGRAYASGLETSQGNAVMFVLITMQKLASSSVAAVRSALKRRLERINDRRKELGELEKQKSLYEELEKLEEGDGLAKIEENILEASSALRLMQNEEHPLRILVSLADAVGEETKILRIMDAVQNKYSGRSVLFFTEYKTTQSILMSALKRKYGDDSVVFINGDERAESVVSQDGSSSSLVMSRKAAAARFNSGKARFLVSTEAGGEGIDLQENCHTLIHVDLPWNPMRLHQRVGRLNRYGQKERVDVLSIRNPDTVESIIWARLEEKISRINLALQEVMDDPEDMLQLVLGMASPGMFRDIFSEAATVNMGLLKGWFDEKSATFGGASAISTVKKMLGSVTKFDFGTATADLPRVDLPDLKPFMESSLTLNQKRPMNSSNGMSFNTPDIWQTDHRVRKQYKDMIFDRKDKSDDAYKRLLGVGHIVVDTAIEASLSSMACIAVLPSEVMQRPLAVFKIFDRVTDSPSGGRIIAVGVEIADDGLCTLMPDWVLLKRMNQLPYSSQYMQRDAAYTGDMQKIKDASAAAREYIHIHLNSLDHGFNTPDVEPMALMCPEKW